MTLSERRRRTTNLPWTNLSVEVSYIWTPAMPGGSDPLNFPEPCEIEILGVFSDNHDLKACLSTGCLEELLKDLYLIETAPEEAYL